MSVELDRGMATRQTLSAILLSQLDMMESNIPGIRDDIDNVLGDIVDYQVQQEYLSHWEENFPGQRHHDVKAAMDYLGKDLCAAGKSDKKNVPVPFRRICLCRQQGTVLVPVQQDRDDENICHKFFSTIRLIL